MTLALNGYYSNLIGFGLICSYTDSGIRNQESESDLCHSAYVELR